MHVRANRDPRVRAGYRWLAIFAAALTVIAPNTNAQGVDLQALEIWLQKPIEAQEPSYPFVRCAGLYLGIMDYTGTQRLGETATNQYVTAISLLSLAASKVRSDAVGGTPPQYLEQIANDRKNVADLYIARMQRNYAATGQAAIEDPVMQSDLKLCRAMVDRFRER